MVFDTAVENLRCLNFSPANEPGEGTSPHRDWQRNEATRRRFHASAPPTGRRRREPDGSASRPLAAPRKTGVPDGARAKQTFLASYDIAQTRNVTAQILCGVSASQSLLRSGQTSRHESCGKTNPAQLLCDALTMFVVGDRVAAGRLKLPAHPALAVETSKLHSLKEKIMDVLLVLIVLLLLFGGGGGLYWGMGMGWGLGPVGLILVAFVVALLLFGYRGRGRG